MFTGDVKFGIAPATFTRWRSKNAMTKNDGLRFEPATGMINCNGTEIAALTDDGDGGIARGRVTTVSLVLDFPARQWSIAYDGDNKGTVHGRI